MSWLHSLRYKNILEVLSALALKKQGKRIVIVDIGCAQAKLFQLLSDRFEIDYTGIEISTVFVELARSRYGHNANFRIVHESAENTLPQMQNADICIALESFEHIPDHELEKIVEVVAAARPAIFVCSVPVEIGPAIWLKNIGSFLTGYPRHKEYRWIETFWAGLYRLDKLPPHGIGHKGFDWRCLAQTIGHAMEVTEVRKFPFGFMPAALAFSIFIIAEPKKKAGA